MNSVTSVASCARGPTHILTLPRCQAPALPESGCWPVSTLDFLQPPLWQDRAAVEHNERYLQPIVYLLLLNDAAQVWGYQRRGGDARLDGRCSCGVGGHVDAQDAQSTPDQYDFDSCSRIQDGGYSLISSKNPENPENCLRRALLRELHEELQARPTDLAGLRLRGLIYEGYSAIGRVHLGLLYTAQWLGAQPPCPRAGEKLASLGFVDLAEVSTQPRFELWSRLAAQHLLDAAAQDARLGKITRQ